MGNRAVLQYPNRKQFIVTLPKGLVLAKGWKSGDLIEFLFDEQTNIILRKLNNKAKITNKSILQFRNRKQFIITIPKALVLAKGWSQGDIIEFVLDRNANIIIKKVADEQ